MAIDTRIELISWTKEKCRKEARKYESRTQFQLKNQQAYRSACKRDWLKEICKHMEGTKNNAGERQYWNRESCIKEGKKYEYKTDFMKESPGAYAACKRLNCLKEATGHLKILLNRHWTKDACRAEALKYKSRSDFSIYSKGAYIFSGRRGWRAEICSHMISDFTFWNYTLVKKEALKYKTRTEFARKSGSAYGYATINELLDKICKHMVPIGNLFKRMIYAFEFSDNCVYIGLTYNEKKRKSEHLTDNKGPVAKHIRETGLKPKYKNLSAFVIVGDAKRKEQMFIEKYRETGWTILNSIKAGALGGNSTKWTKEECLRVAKLYNRRIDFHNSPTHYTAYSAAAKHGWLQEACKHMKLLKKYWSKELCLKEAKKYKSRIDFMRKSGGAYNYAKLHKFLEEACSHMRVILNSWTKDECKIEANKYQFRGDFEKYGRGAYTYAQRRGWLVEVCSHMKYKLTLWDREKCRIEALKYKSRKAFQVGSGSAYGHARKKGLLDEIGSHFERPESSNKKWDRESCQKVALKCKSRGAFKNLNASAYAASRKGGWLDEICSHMITKDISTREVRI